MKKLIYLLLFFPMVLALSSCSDEGKPYAEDIVDNLNKEFAEAGLDNSVFDEYKATLDGKVITLKIKVSEQVAPIFALNMAQMGDVADNMKQSLKGTLSATIDKENAEEIINILAKEGYSFRWKFEIPGHDDVDVKIPLKDIVD